jgi:hypothetical protein
MIIFSDYYKKSNIIKKIIIERDINRDLIYLNLLKFKVGDILIVFF